MQTASVKPSSMRQHLDQLLNRPVVQHGILALIIFNAVLLGLETAPGIMAQWGAAIHWLDKAILAVFVLEIAARIYVHRLSFFKDPWSVFDFVVVAIALLPATGPFAVLRALRVLRVLRVLTIVPSMRRVVGALLSAIPGLMSIALVLMLVFYVFAVIATHLFGPQFPEWFGHLGRSLYTLFQVMTLESWSMGISRPVMEQFPYAWLFFVPFILIATFTMLNLFIAVIVGAMQTVADEEQKETALVVKQAAEHIEADMHAEIRSLRQDIQALRALLETQGRQERGQD